VFVTTIGDFFIPHSQLTILEQIGSGQFGEVYKGIWRHTEVAIKVIKIVESDKEKTLSLAKQELKTLICDIALKISRAIVYMHLKAPPVIHHDIKPHNVLVTHDFTGVFICDLGLSKMFNSTQTLTTSTGNGTPTYMAPEMYQKVLRGTPVDIYSFGCLLIELFSRKRLWEGFTAIEVMQRVIGSYNTPPTGPNLSNLEEEYRSVCENCVKLEPDERPTAEEVFSLLSHLSNSINQ
jgi:serine/threonine protein kinase